MGIKVIKKKSKASDEETKVKKTKAEEKPAKKSKEVKEKKSPKKDAPESISDFPPSQRKLIEKAIKLDDTITSAKEDFNAALLELRDAGVVSFPHPDYGQYSIMVRGDTVYWRPTPAGKGKKKKSK